jgi:predicted enzyme related to lactoylglutathione lyase
MDMSQQVVHFEIVGSEPAKLRGYYGELFGWEFQVGDANTEKVSRPGEYGFVEAGESGINGGVGGGEGFESRVLFYIGVPDVEAALRKAESLGGTRVMGPEPASGEFAVGHFADPQGNLVGVAGPPNAQEGRG